MSILLIFPFNNAAYFFPEDLNVEIKWLKGGINMPPQR
jgi:hypothetical protein